MSYAENFCRQFAKTYADCRAMFDDKAWQQVWEEFDNFMFDSPV